jgi:hypothetical protein
MVFHLVKKDELRLDVPGMSTESSCLGGGMDSPKSNTSSIRMSALRSRSSKRSSAYSKDQVRQLIDLFPEISHLRKRASTEDLEELFPDALAELVEILGSTKEVEQELFRRKEAKEREARRSAEREARKTTGVRFATATGDSKVFECLESEALRRAGIAEQALANATAARDKVHTLYKGLLATTNPVKCDANNNDDWSTVSSMHRITMLPTENTADASARDKKKLRSTKSGEDFQGQYPVTIRKERWESLRAEARVVITKRLLVGWTMSSESCHGVECQRCPLLIKQKKMQCVTCGGSGSGKDGMYAAGHSAAMPLAPDLKTPEKSQTGTHTKHKTAKRPSPSQVLKPSLIDSVLTPDSVDSQDTPSDVLGKLTRKIEKNQKNVADAAAEAKSAMEKENDHDEFEYLLEQQRKIQSKKHNSVIVYDVAEDGDNSIEEMEVEKLRRFTPEASQQASRVSIPGPSRVGRNDNRSTEGSKAACNMDRAVFRRSSEQNSLDHRAHSDPVDDDPGIVPLHLAPLYLDNKEKQDILDEVQSILTMSVASSKKDLTAKRTRVGQEILLKTEQGWSLIDASCRICDMPLLLDPAGEKELCVFCEVKQRQETEIHLDSNNSTPSEITDSLCGKPPKGERSPGSPNSGARVREPPVSVAAVHTKSRSDCSGNRPRSITDQKQTLILPQVSTKGFKRNDHRQGANDYENKSPGIDGQASTRRSTRKDLDEIERQLQPVADPAFDSQSTFPIPWPKIEGGAKCVLDDRESETAYQAALRQVASPDFDEHNMFPFLNQSRNGERFAATDGIVGQDEPQHHGFGTMPPQDNLGRFVEHHVLDEPSVMGILPHPAHKSEWQNNFQALQYARQSSSQPSHDAQPRMTAEPHAHGFVPTGWSSLNVDLSTKLSKTQPLATPLDSEWQDSQVKVYSVNTLLEGRQGSGEHFSNPKAEVRDDLPRRTSLQDYGRGPFTQATPHAGQVGHLSAYLDTDEPRDGHDVDIKMKLRVSENMNARRLQDDDGMPAKPVGRTFEPFHSNPQILSSKASIPYVSARGNHVQGNAYPFPPSPLQTSTNFYEQLRTREYAPCQSMATAANPSDGAWQGGGPQTFPSPQIVNSKSQQGTAAAICFASMHQQQRNGGNFYSDSYTILPKAESFGESNNPNKNGIVTEAHDSQMSTISEYASTRGPLPSVLEASNELSGSASEHSMAKTIPVGKEVEPLRNITPTTRETASFILSLGAHGIDGSHASALSGASSSERRHSRRKSLMDDISVSDPARTPLSGTLHQSIQGNVKSSSSRETHYGGDSLVSSIRNHGEANRNWDQEQRGDPPDETLRPVVRGSRAGMDPEEENGLSPRIARSHAIETQASRDSAVAKKESTKGGYSVVIPEGFDFSDEEQLRKLFVSVKEQSEKHRETGARRKEPSTSLVLLSRTKSATEEAMATAPSSTKLLSSPAGVRALLFSSRSHQDDEHSTGPHHQVKTDGSKSPISSSPGLPMFPSLNSAGTASNGIEASNGNQVFGTPLNTSLLYHHGSNAEVTQSMSFKGESQDDELAHSLGKEQGYRQRVKRSETGNVSGNYEPASGVGGESSAAQSVPDAPLRMSINVDKSIALRVASHLRTGNDAGAEEKKGIFEAATDSVQTVTGPSTFIDAKKHAGGQHPSTPGASIVARLGLPKCSTESCHSFQTRALQDHADLNTRSANLIPGQEATRRQSAAPTDFPVTEARMKINTELDAMDSRISSDFTGSGEISNLDHANWENAIYPESPYLRATHDFLQAPLPSHILADVPPRAQDCSVGTDASESNVKKGRAMSGCKGREESGNKSIRSAVPLEPSIATSPSPSLGSMQEGGTKSRQKTESTNSNFNKLSTGYLEALIKSIRAPARVWDDEVPRGGRRDPPTSVQRPVRRHRVAMEPDVSDDSPASHHLLHSEMREELGQITRAAKEPSGINGEDVSRRREPEDLSSVVAAPESLAGAAQGPPDPHPQKILSPRKLTSTKGSNPRDHKPKNSSLDMQKQPIKNDFVNVEDVFRGREPEDSSDEIDVREYLAGASSGLPDSHPQKTLSRRKESLRSKNGSNRRDPKPEQYNIDVKILSSRNPSQTHPSETDRRIKGDDLGPGTLWGSWQHLDIDDVRNPGRRKNYPKPELATRKKKSTQSIDTACETSYNTTHARKQVKNICPSGESGETPALEPRVQSPYFDGVSTLGPDSDPAILSPVAKSSAFIKQSENHAPHLQQRLPAVAGENLFPSATHLSQNGRVTVVAPSRHKTPRAPSCGEDEASQKEKFLSSSTKTSLTQQKATEHQPLRFKRTSHDTKNTNKSTSSVSSWTSGPSTSYGPQEARQRSTKPSSWTSWTSGPSISYGPQEARQTSTNTKPPARRRLGDNLRFGLKPNASAVSSPSYSSSSGRNSTKTPKKDHGSPRHRKAQPRTLEYSSQPLKDATQRCSFGSFSSWATPEKSGPVKRQYRSEQCRKPESRSEDMFFVGGPLLQDRGKSNYLLSPASEESDSTPFEDILNRCKYKLEQLSLVENDHTECKNSAERKYMSTASSHSESQIIDLVDVIGDERTTRSAKTARTARSGSTTRSANY